MKCDKFRDEIELGMSGSEFDFSADLKSHLRTCELCAAYYSELKLMKSALDSQKFEVLPGELDNITFENIVKSDQNVILRPRFSEILYKGFRKWAWAPVAAAAVILLLLRLPGSTDKPSGNLSSPDQASNPIWSDLSTAADSGLWPYVVGSLMDDGQDLDMVSEELSRNVNFNDELSNLDDEELQYLYNNIDELRGET